MRNKRKVLLAFIVSIMFLMGSTLLASAAGVLSIAVSSGSVAVGDSLTITVYANGTDNSEVTADMKITYDPAVLEYVSSSKSGASAAGGAVTVSASEVDLKFKAVGSGNTKIQASGAAVTAAGTTVNVSGTAADNIEADSAKSGDNSLSSLSLSKGTLSPSFQGKTTKYTASVGSDVSEIKVNAVPVNSKAEIESITGNTGLKDGDNTISVVVKAENGVKATYTISVKKGGTISSEDTKDTDTKTEETMNQDSANDEPKDNASQSDSGLITINGINYSISQDFSKADIPERFIESTVDYKGSSCQGFIYDKGQVGLFYLKNEDSGQYSFFVYDVEKDVFYPYVKLENGERFIIPIIPPKGTIPPEDFEETEWNISELGSLQAYQYVSKDGSQKEEILNFDSTEAVEQPEGTEMPAVTGGSDFYVFYAIDEEGTMGWYQYDNRQSTYQRLNAEIMPSSSDENNYDTLLSAYNELSDRHNKTKTNDRRLITILIFVSAVLIIVIVNLLLRGRNRDEEDWEEDEEEEEIIVKRPTPKERLLREKREREKENIPEESVLKTNVPRENDGREKLQKASIPEEKKKMEAPIESDFYDADDDDTFAEFEMEPSIISRGGKKKKERIKESQIDKKSVTKRTVSSKEPEDDDIEFIDLDD